MVYDKYVYSHGCCCMLYGECVCSQYRYWEHHWKLISKVVEIKDVLQLTRFNLFLGVTGAV